MIGFLTDTVKANMYDPLTKQTGKLAYQVDTNLDGKYDDKDNYKDDYNYYILTSNYSFSCSNLFTHVCQENGLAKVVGMTSGGGACVVYYSATPDGKCFRISGNMREGKADNYVSHNDDGVSVDYPLDKEYFYNDSYINNFLNNLNK